MKVKANLIRLFAPTALFCSAPTQRDWSRQTRPSTWAFLPPQYYNNHYDADDDDDDDIRLFFSVIIVIIIIIISLYIIFYSKETQPSSWPSFQLNITTNMSTTEIIGMVMMLM